MGTARDLTQMAEHLRPKHKVLSLIPCGKKKGEWNGARMLISNGFYKNLLSGKKLSTGLGVWIKW
jgi:hypothetical protein